MSSVQFQQTINCPVVCAGVGVHSGERARVVMKPAKPGTGIRFRRVDIDDQDNEVCARGDHVSEVQLGTTLRNEAGVTVATVEHLLAACAGVGVDNLIIEIDGPEVPIMDGSSAVYCELLLSAGLRQQGVARRRIRILEPVEVKDGVKTARLSPSADNYLTIHAKIEFQSRAIGTQQMSLRLVPGMFARDIAFARTFGFAQDVAKLQAMGLARGGSLDNAVVLDGDEIMNPEGLRTDDEFIRHKILDAVGDLMLAGAPIAGVYEARQPGHALNNQLVRALIEQPDAWCWESDEDEDARIGLQASARA
ncbi:MAG: UDP-3-O-acyl-N-acetylglucosamine deacetylase [Henriciella sp.]|uniref:UDP-3-O-acyl-N-acetylglucosamine deacetylase n=1 Tax=Henriciella sp. TaxID=1968823 RepID=UPI003C730DF8